MYIDSRDKEYLDVQRSIELMEEIEGALGLFGGDDAEHQALRIIKEKYQAYRDSL